MRPYLRLSAAPLLAVAVACSSDEAARTTVDAALERDLRLASASLALVPSHGVGLTSLETAPPPMGAAPAPRPRAASAGPQRVRSERPSVAAAPSTEQAADADEGTSAEAPAISVAESDSEPSGESTGAGVALPRPTPTSAGLPSAGTQGSGEWGAGRGPTAGEIMGGVIGVVLRGGGVGGIDDCEIHDTRGRRPVYRPASGGVGVGRWPVADRGQTDTRTGQGRGGRAWPSGGRVLGRQ